MNINTRMAKSAGSITFPWLTSIAIMAILSWSGAIDDPCEEKEDRKVHIVFLGGTTSSHMGRGQQYSSLSDYHRSVVEQVLAEGTSVDDALVASYWRSFNGFAAKLTDVERDRLASMKDQVVSVFPSRTLHPQTTRSWDFMGFHQKVNRSLSVESDIIIGVIDTGIWPESESFSDDGFGPIPQKWKGSCSGGANFTCNNKIIGARFYPKSKLGIDSARDDQGHGTHTASTAAGNPVMDASFFGLAQGTARGAVPSARIAVYKVCHPNAGCNDTDILAAFDDAIADGVDIISISLGSDVLLQFKDDSIAIGSFHAMEKGILTVNSAGNSGPDQGLTVSMAPWLFSVAASGTDRRIMDKLVLANGTTVVGDCVNSFSSNGTKFPVINGYDATTTNCSGNGTSGLCVEDLCLDSKLVKGKIVLCLWPDGILEAFAAGAVGVISSATMHGVSFVFPLPAVLVLEFHELQDYVNSNKNPVAEILKSEALNDTTAPMVSHFSSRGPNALVPEIMKPDISAPGVEILAAFSPTASPSKSPMDKRSVKYSILSGTSMACPHVAGAAAYVKSFHPDWSPSAIKSALMTTAWPMAPREEEGMAQEFASGSGHLNPVPAVDPGLVYEVLKEDYVKLLCNIEGVDTPTLRLISGDNSACNTSSNTSNNEKLLAKDFNYPAMSIQVLPMQAFAVNFTRTVTNVGFANSTYKADVSSNPMLNVTVEPQLLFFNSLNEKKSFTVSVAGGEIVSENMLSSSLVWSDGIHSVRSPIVVYVISRRS